MTAALWAALLNSTCALIAGSFMGYVIVMLWRIRDELREQRRMLEEISGMRRDPDGLEALAREWEQRGGDGDLTWHRARQWCAAELRRKARGTR